LDCNAKPSASSAERLQQLVYELLDAHDDTARMAQGIEDIRWAAHLDYLRRLQRLGRETLASTAAMDGAGPMAEAQGFANRHRPD
jgi:hypothetical protein